MAKKYIVFGADSVLVMRLIEGIHEIPPEAVEVDEELWQRTMQETDGVWMIDSEGGIAKHPFPPPTPEEILASNQRQQVGLIQLAAQSMAPVLLSLQLGDATDDESDLARQWQTYYRALKAVDLTVPEPEWPVRPQEIAES